MDKYVLVEYLSSIKTAICETFKHTQRIKLTSFDVSNHYIILGTNSGGIYIFKRTPCEFLRLIPSKEGSTVHVKISPDEKNLAVASARGLVIILENFFADLNVRPLLFTEHEGHAITVMKWHGNSVYTGDNNGKIAVCSVHAKLTKAIFQTPSSTLMSLDSSIVQIDTYKNYLLISTKTRTYLCDTEKEQYKQIGKKLRDGNFGACFSQTDFSDHFDRCEGVRKAFKTIEGEDSFSSKVSNDVRLYCSRPGARLWTANFEATVLSTYQFRNSLNVQSSDLITIESAKDTRLRVTKFDEIEISKDFNFCKVYLLYKNIIMTYDHKGIYFFNVEKNNIVCWSHAFDNIRDVKILKPHIYVWRNDLQINIISLQSLEEIVINTLISKQYLLCSDLCVQFNEEVFALIEKSKKINLISILRTKLKELEENDLLGKIENILDKLDEYYKDQTVGLKFENGIVLVENQYSAQATTLPENIESNFENLDTNKDLKILYKQYVLNKTHKLAELTESSKILTNTNLDELPSLFESFIKYVKDKSEEDATLWCKEQLLKFVSKSLYNFDQLKPPTVEALSRYFLDLNNYKTDCGKCGFPLPRAHKRKLDHYKLACKLFNYTENKPEYLNNIPLLYKINACDLALNLAKITQFSDKEVFKKVLFTMTYDKWDDVIKLYIKLSQGQCLNCTETIDIDGLLTWTELGMLMVESIGPKNANRLVTRYAQYIPKGELKQEFYQSCLFSMTCPNQGVAVKFVEEVRAAGSSKMVEQDHNADPPVTTRNFQINNIGTTDGQRRKTYRFDLNEKKNLNETVSNPNMLNNTITSGMNRTMEMVPTAGSSKTDTTTAGKQFIFTGPVEKVIHWNMLLQDRFSLCLYEVIATMVCLQEGTIKTQKIMLVRNIKGPVLQVVYYVFTQIDLDDFHLGMTVRCVGSMIGYNILKAVSIRAATQDEIDHLERMSLISDQAVNFQLTH